MLSLEVHLLEYENKHFKEVSSPSVSVFSRFMLIKLCRENDFEWSLGPNITFLFMPEL